MPLLTRFRAIPRRAFVLPAWVLCGLAASLPALAQTSTEADRQLSDQLARTALAAMTRQAQPDENHSRAAMILLELASERNPDDPELWRLLAEVAGLAGETAEQASAWARYATLRPTDDAAMLQLLLLRLGQTQTLDGRLASLERVLAAAETSGKLSEPLRSRLAVLAAEAALELGDEPRYLKWVKQAARLDPGNAIAAGEMFKAIAGRTDDPKLLGAAAINWVKAAPVSGPARETLAAVLTSQAAYLDAAQQYAIAAAFTEGGALPWRSYRAWALCLAATGDEAGAIGLLDSIDDFIEQSAKAGIEADPAYVPELTGLPTVLEVLRLTLQGGVQATGVVSSDAELDRDAVRASYDRILSDLALALSEAGDDAELTQNTRLQAAWLQAIFGPGDLDEDAALADVPGDNPIRHRIRGWLALRAADESAAREAFALVPDDPFAQLGLAWLTDSEDGTRRTRLRDLVRAHPESLAALLAMQELRSAQAGDTTPTPEGETLLDLMKRAPAPLWRMDTISDPWLQMQVKARPTVGQVYWPVNLEVSIRNGSDMAVALGPGQTLRPLVFLNVAVFQDGQIVGSLPTQVVDLGRRLTLDPGQRVTVSHRLDWGSMGMATVMNPTQNFSYAVSATLDPRVLPDGTVLMGPLGSTETLRALLVRGRWATDETATGWLDAMSGGSERDEVIGMIRLARLSPIGGAVSPDLVAQARDLIAERAPAMDTSRLALAAFHLNAVDGGSSARRVLDLAKRSEDDAVRVMHLIGQALRPDDPAISAALRSGSPRLQAFAEAWRGVMITLAEQAAAEAQQQAQP